ncbi:hypothetical protein GALMADRAFT_247176 [Galerina marginata CBS 339.88]|uniref:Uncharacterized protein n=1 Tax=Galerina marginata (strain CBS 339.88) TaxID=685588 RepID=A0A067SYQ0_GALM3|nr:hypothetical protein GALMADRAFT_247176 [Galerina marginata CBS 339.88]
MPFIIGIALINLDAGSPVFVEVISGDDEIFNNSFHEQIVDPSNMISTFEKIATVIGGPFYAISLSLPSFLTKEEREAIVKAAKAVPAFSVRWIRPIENINTVLYSKPWIQVDYKAQYELVLEIASDAATSRLISTQVEENFRELALEKEITIKTISSVELVAELVDPALAALKDMPPQPPQPEHNYKIVVEEHSLKRVLILDSSPYFVSPLVNALKSKFQGLKPPVEILVESSSSALARYAAARALEDHQADLRWEAGEFFIFNVAPLRVGIVKADGFVATAIKRNWALPVSHTLMFTTSKDNQTSATIKFVAGIAPRAADDNTVIVELVLRGLKPGPKGVPRISITIDVEQMERTRIVAEEVTDGWTAGGATASVELERLLGDMAGDDIASIVENHRDLADGNAPRDPEAEDSEARWYGKDVLGDLPE